MAWWNIAERKLFQTTDGHYYVNTPEQELVFFHFSGYNPGSEYFTGRNLDASEYTFEKRPELIGIFNEYKDLLYQNGFEELSVCTPKLNFAYALEKVPSTFKNKIKRAIKRIIK